MLTGLYNLNLGPCFLALPRWYQGQTRSPLRDSSIFKNPRRKKNNGGFVFLHFQLRLKSRPTIPLIVLPTKPSSHFIRKPKAIEEKKWRLWVSFFLVSEKLGLGWIEGGFKFFDRARSIRRLRLPSSRSRLLQIFSLRALRSKVSTY